MKQTRTEKLKERVEEAIVDSVDENALLGPKSKLVVGNLPTAPDPFWPTGVSPLHLPPMLQKTESIREAFRPAVGEEWHCRKCGSTQNQSKEDNTICSLCAVKDTQNTALAKKTNDNWMEEAKELGIEAFERQPAETDTEWRIWTEYRSYYPMKLPTYSELAAKTGYAVATVVKAAQRWSYKVRLIDWARYTDADIQERRIESIRDMNERQLKMTDSLQTKLETAIESLNVTTLKPSELATLFKLTTDLERKIKTYVETPVVQSGVAEGGNKNNTLTKAENIDEIIKILQKTGVMDSRTIGIEQSTKIVFKDGEKNVDNSSNVYSED